MKFLFLWAITAYQRHLSPRKGYGCAYRIHTGCAGCSALGYRAVRRYGVLRGWQVLRRRLFLCGVAHRRHGQRIVRPAAAQRGDCDPGCDLPLDGSCDGSGKGPAGRLCDGLSCCGDAGSCDGPDRKRQKQRAQEAAIHLPRHRR